jgi:hypothetical protein
MLCLTIMSTGFQYWYLDLQPPETHE